MHLCRPDGARWRVFTCVVWLLASAAHTSPARAQELPSIADDEDAQERPSIVDDEDAQLWMQFNSQIPVTRTWTLVLEGQPRWNQNVTHFDQVVLRGGIGARLTSAVQVGAAYAFIPRRTIIGTVYEHQTYEQVQILLPRLAGWQPQLRFREDQRYLAEWGDTAHRAREQLRISRPLPARADWRLILYEEAFFNLNHTVRGPARGVDQFRLYSGLQRPLSGSLWVEVGYMFQDVRTLGDRPHRQSHNAMVQFQFRPRGQEAGGPGFMPVPMPAPAAGAGPGS